MYVHYRGLVSLFTQIIETNENYSKKYIQKILKTEFSIIQVVKSNNVNGKGGKYMKISIRWRIIALVISIVIVGLGSLATISSLIITDKTEQSVVDQSETLVAQVSSNITNFLSFREYTSITFSSLSETKKKTKAKRESMPVKNIPPAECFSLYFFIIFLTFL